MRPTKFAAFAIAASFAFPAFADIQIRDAYARAATPSAMTGAAFMEIVNSADTEDRLIEARSDIAARVELHTHESDANGVMRMIEVEEGFAIPAGGTHMLARGGDHVMFMGLNQPLVQGESVSVTLVFENAGEVAVEIPVDLERQPKHGAMGQGHRHGHGN
jgi:copper(I)-binding protein